MNQPTTHPKRQAIAADLRRQSEARKRGCSRLSLMNLRHRESYRRQFYVKAGWQERTEAANFIYPMS